MDATIEAISLSESQRLTTLEATILRGLATFIEVGEALTEIRDSKLYRIEHGTFEEYCEAKWKMKRRNAYDLMNTAAVAKNVQSIAQIDRATARVLVGLSQEEQIKVLDEAIVAAVGGRVEAKRLKAVCDKANAERVPYRDENTPESSCDARAFSSMAISQLKRILPTDPWREIGLAMARDYIDGQLSDKPPTAMDSPNLKNLKAAWKRCTYKDKIAFLSWKDTSPSSQKRKPRGEARLS